jgi:3-deoxy-D-manno-octulosonate 8-phosphate phosphatase (KDO 8-P phosphatase)
MSHGLRDRFARIRLLVVDVDGVLTDAGMYYGEGGEELKKFDTRDGHGIKLLQAAGVPTAIVTREKTDIVARRARKLGIEDVHQGAFDKGPIVVSLMDKHRVAREQVCYVGDDLGDAEALEVVGLPVAVSDALPGIKRLARYVTRRPGGAGAVREVCDLILAARGGSRIWRAIPGTVVATWHRTVRTRLHVLLG